MHTWQNTTLGEPVEPERGEGVEPHALLSRLEIYEAQVPRGAAFLTAGIDTQDDRLEALVVGWGRGEEAWLVDRQRLTGQTSEPGPWLQLEELLGRQYRHESGAFLPIGASCLDTAGHRTAEAYVFAARMRQRARHRLYACIGRDGQRPIVSSPSPRTWGKEARPVELYTVGVDAAKDLIQNRLGLEEPAAADGARATGGGPGRVHLPAADWVDDELAQQLTSERLVTKYSKGVPVKVWKQIRPRNEMLDCFVLGLAALRLARVDLGALAQRLAKPQESRPPVEARPRVTGGLSVPDDWLEPRRR
jgi:phage terminase large subunit GpA-like protein